MATHVSTGPRSSDPAFKELLREAEQPDSESKRFAIETIQRSRAFADEFTHRIYDDAPRPLQGEALLSLLRANVWREYMLGCQGPAKLMILLPDEHVDLKYLLTHQVADELRHSNVFAARVTALGGEGRITHYTPNEEDWQLFYATVHFDDPAELVTSLNCTGEVVLQQSLIRIAERKGGRPAIVDDETADVIEAEMIYDEDEDSDQLGSVVDAETAAELERDVIPDEGRHVKIGRLVLERFATTDEVRERCRAIQDRKFAALDAAHGRTMRDAREFSQRALGLGG